MLAHISGAANRFMGNVFIAASALYFVTFAPVAVAYLLAPAFGDVIMGPMLEVFDLIYHPLSWIASILFLAGLSFRVWQKWRASH